MGSGVAFVTGGSGFVGKHLVGHLRKAGIEPISPSREELDICDANAVRYAVKEVSPTILFHLAAFSSPSLSWKRPTDAFLSNVKMTLNLLEAIRNDAPEAVLLLVGTGQVYGNPEVLPATEKTPMNPGNPYAASKAAAEMMGDQYANGYGTRVVRVRPFNHAGPGQTPDYVISSVTMQIASAEIAGDKECVVRTGNPDSARDFTDVRDVVRAYTMATSIASGVFNVCRGEATSISEVVALAGAHAHIPVRHQIDPERLRAHDAHVLYGSHARLSAACNWRPQIPIETTICDTLDWWRERLSGERDLREAR